MPGFLGSRRASLPTSAPSRDRLCRYGVPCLILMILTGLILILVFCPRSPRDYDLPELYTISAWRVSRHGDQLIEQLQRSLEKIGSNSEPATFENTILPLDAIFSKYYTSVYACQAHYLGAAEPERAHLLQRLGDPATLRNAKLYERVRSVFELLPEGSQDHRFAKACEWTLRGMGSSLNATSVERFDQLHIQLSKSRKRLKESQSTDHELAQGVIAAQNQIVQLISPYDDYASYQIAESCAGSSEEVESLLVERAQLYRTIGLARFHRELGHRSPANVVAWDEYQDSVLSRLSMLHEARLNQEDVLWKGIFFVAKKLYGLDVVERFDIPKHHSGVRVFEFLEEDGTKLGLVFMDLKRREFKPKIDYAAPLMVRSFHLKLDRAATLLVINIPANTKQINLYELYILFHEFGHCLHMLFSNPKYTLLSAIHAPLDWLEFPSQFHEMWAHDPEVLRNIDPSLTDNQISQIQNEFAFADALKKFHDLLCGIAGYHWNRLTQAPANIDVFVSELQTRYGLQFISDPQRYLSPQVLHDSSSSTLAYGYSFSWRTARSAQDWMKANGGLCRKTGHQIRQETFSKGWSVPYEDMIESYRYDNVTLHDDLTHLPIRLASNKPLKSRHFFSV